MGQYYKPVNIDNYEHIYSWDYGNGQKLMEHSWLGNNMMLLVMDLISPGGRWEKCRLVWAGDYMDKDLYLPEEDCDIPKDNYDYTLYSYLCESKHNLRLKTLQPKDGYAYKSIVNHDKGLYVDLTDLKRGDYVGKDGWTIHPLSILTCSGNGRGGGDYHGTYMKLVGSWAGNRVSSAYDIPDGFKKLKVNFIENR